MTQSIEAESPRLSNRELAWKHFNRFFKGHGAGSPRVVALWDFVDDLDANLSTAQMEIDLNKAGFSHITTARDLRAVRKASEFLGDIRHRLVQNRMDNKSSTIPGYYEALEEVRQIHRELIVGYRPSDIDPFVGEFRVFNHLKRARGDLVREQSTYKTK